MRVEPGPILEVTYAVEEDNAAGFDAWLREWSAAVRSSGVGVEAFVPEASDHEPGTRIVHYVFDGEPALEAFPAEQIDSPPGWSVKTRRVLRPASSEPANRPICLNCGAVLAGQYCGSCGQRASSRLISVWELMRDAFGDLFDVDSRFWRTLVPLIVRPGRLTKDYLEGRRARYMPPFRTYLVLSLVFFLVAFFDPREEFGLFFGEAATEPQAAAGNAGLPDPVASDSFVGDEDPQPTRDRPTDPRPSGDEVEGVRIIVGSNGNESGGGCEDLELGDVPDWLAPRLTLDRAKAICERMVADSGRAFAAKLLDNAPAALFLLLPLMALVLKIMYPLSRKYYVEHLLFVVHYHAFVFLILTLQIAWQRLVESIGAPGALSALATATVSLYVPTYLFLAMARVYGQNAVLRTLKYLALLFCYVAGLAIIFAITAILAAFSI